MMINENNFQDSSFTVTFSIKYETKFGQNIYILGGVKELGNWKNKVAKMKWHEGHLWKLKVNFEGDVKGFEYKFAISEKETLKWEGGHNRLFSKKNFEDEEHIELKAVWERFYVTFMIYFPVKNENEVMQIMGAPIAIGKWFQDGGKPLRMKLGDERNLNIIKGRFWEARVEFDSNDGHNFDFEYRYSLYNTTTSKS